MKSYKVKKISRRKFNNGWTYGEAHKIWRMANRESKLNNGWVRPSFKDWVNSLIFIPCK